MTEKGKYGLNAYVEMRGDLSRNMHDFRAKRVIANVETMLYRVCAWPSR